MAQAKRSSFCSTPTTAPALMAALVLLGGSSALAAGGSSQVPSARQAGSLLSSRQLWATINICNPKDQPDMVGIRGSMPAGGQPQDKMYMSFRLQYLNLTSGHWTDLAATASPSFLSVGSHTARQGGQSFQLVPVSGRPAVKLRGLVEFQWRRGKKLLLSARRPTTAGHRSLAGADPAGFSAATCQIG